MNNKPRVTAIIPTIGRDSLRASVESVLNQRLCDSEAVVVLDAPEQSNFVEDLLRGLPHVLTTTNRKGAAAARNAGLAIATGEYVGYLDDDDIWLPEKCISQIEAILLCSEPRAALSVVATEFVRQDGTTKRPLEASISLANIANRLVARKTVRYPGTYFNTPSLLGPSGLMKACKWDEALAKHQDWDLLIRLATVPGIQLAVVERVLVRVFQGSRGSLSLRSDWRDGQTFLEKHKAAISGRSRADFVLLHMLRHAIRSRSVEGIHVSLSQMGWTIPHLGAVARFAAGLVHR